MKLAINTIDGWGLSNEACRELLPKNLFTLKANQLYITNTSVLKVGMPCKLQSENWPIVLQQEFQLLSLESMINFTT